MRARFVPPRILVATLFVMSCSAMPLALPAAVGYNDIVTNSTQSRAIYDGLDAVAFVYVTNETEVFKSARAQKLAKTYHVPIDQAFLRGGGDIAVAEGDEHEFFVALNTADRYANNMEQPTSEWGVSLLTPKGVFQPNKVSRMATRPVELQAYFPFFTSFFVPYRVLFPKEVGDGPYTLVVANPRASARFIFLRPMLPFAPRHG